MVEHLPAPSDLVLYRTEDEQTRIEVRLAEEQYDIFNQQRLKQEAESEALTDDAELKKYLEGE